MRGSGVAFDAKPNYLFRVTLYEKLDAWKLCHDLALEVYG